MFSEDTLVNMANNTLKPIKLLKVNDIIINKFKKPVKISKIHILKQQPAVEVQLENISTPFNCSPLTKFASHHVLHDNSHSSYTDSIINIYNSSAVNSRLKNSMVMFSYSSDVAITLFEENPILLDLYCIHTNDPSQSFFINDVITFCNIDT